MASGTAQSADNPVVKGAFGEEVPLTGGHSTNTVKGEAAKTYSDALKWLQESSEGSGTMSSDNEKFFEERFKRVDDRIEHQNEMFNSKIDRVIDKIDNMSESLKKNSDRMEKVEDKVGRFSLTVWKAVITLVIGLGGLVYILAQMQESWLQKYLDIVMQIPK